MNPLNPGCRRMTVEAIAKPSDRKGVTVAKVIPDCACGAGPVEFTVTAQGYVYRPAGSDPRIWNQSWTVCGACKDGITEQRAESAAQHPTEPAPPKQPKKQSTESVAVVV